MTPWPDIETLVPHAGRMCLLDTVLACDSHHIEAVITPTKQDPFASEAGVGAHVGLEWMAQAVAAWATLNASNESRVSEPAPGMLISSRHFETTRDYFIFDEPVMVIVELEFSGANGLRSFHGKLTVADQLCAEGVFRIYQPDAGQPATNASQEP
ncbi:hypothetical protein [Kushneria phosphatilytica]|uniref:Uncharacterized protein n=1 Tax=Kushneria phosphatilytica TaxID=657387 RepID=A0A1S1NVI1_9GAMM|nr:hypothetical protein [Kushneria phosphatilytica]OHV10546.1 hypothetical protein BH688_09125 [Kushneria phosphatilytica]QEL11883.1 hypothetical protein FY550_12545 [Kushneria phosphatilytica]